VKVEDAVDEVLSNDAPAPEQGADARVDEIAALAAALESADELPLDERLELLRRAEATISRSLEGLDGL
jgi:exonuclease VII small subunit